MKLMEQMLENINYQINISHYSMYKLCTSVNMTMFGGFKVENPLQDSVTQLVEYYTFNVGVIGSSPIRVTKRMLRCLE